MAGNGSDWNSIMQSRPVRIAMYGICVMACLSYGIDGIMEMMSPERSAYMMQVVGPTGYYIMTIARVAVCLGTGVIFARMAAKVYAEKEE